MRVHNSHAVIGLGFGDEGKGHVVDWLCSDTPDAVVFRFSGGPQAAHHVVLPDGTDHVFSHFGSGTLRGALTNWSKFCPINPVSLNNELVDLEAKGVKNIRLRIDPECPVITPLELMWNRQHEARTLHGTCEAGIYAVKRREEAGYHIWYEDLFAPEVLKIKLKMLLAFYEVWEEDIDFTDFLYACSTLTDVSPDSSVQPGIFDGKTCPRIFEGSQGLLLDQNYGFYPHVTPSNTGCQNIPELNFGNRPGTLWYVTRAYATRHGAGPMSNELSSWIQDNPYEKSGDRGPQGRFRKGVLDLDLLCYAAHKNNSPSAPNVVVTCFDLLDGYYPLYERGQLKSYSSEEFLFAIKEAVGAHQIFVSIGPTSDDIGQVHP